MDYRKPVVFGENWSQSRYKVLPYFGVEKSILTRPDVQRILDLGCAAGWNMSRFVQYGRRPLGVDVVPERVKWAAAHGPVAVASGLELPFVAETYDCLYVQHVLHHIGDAHQALREAHRCLRDGGHLFLVETIEDNPLIRWGRRLHPQWLGDEVNVRFDLASLLDAVSEAGFEVVRSEQYSVLFWMWEIVPDRIPIMEKLTPFFVPVERIIDRIAHRYGAHCYVLAVKTGS